MNAGFASLTKTKTFLLPAATRARSDWDNSIVEIGLGVVAMIENYCGRKFQYQAGDTFTCGADRQVIVVPRYPVVSFNAVELQTEAEGQWENIIGSVIRFEYDSGVVLFRNPAGELDASLRITYTGGYWWDTSEDDSQEAPAGAEIVPYDLKTAWLLQLQAIAHAQDLFGSAAAKPQSTNPNKSLPALELLPAVKQAINPYRRFAA